MYILYIITKQSCPSLSDEDLNEESKNIKYISLLITTNQMHLKKQLNYFYDIIQYQVIKNIKNTYLKCCY